MWEQLRGGAAGFKLHEDWGTTPAAIDACLTVADAAGVQVALHSDTLNEMGFVEDTLGGDRRPRHPRLPHRGRRRRARARHHHGRRRAQRAAQFDQPDPAAHRQHPRRAPRHADGVPPPEPQRAEDLAFAESRIRPSTIAAEDLLHDIGAISMIGSDAQAMGRIGEVVHADLADRARDEAAPRRACRATARRRQQPGPPLRREVHDLPGHRARPRPRDRLGRGRQAGRSGAVGAGVLRRAPARGDQGRHDRLGRDG